MCATGGAQNDTVARKKATHRFEPPIWVHTSSSNGLGKFPGVHMAQLWVSPADDGGSNYPTNAE